jgi:uncharacterized protein
VRAARGFGMKHASTFQAILANDPARCGVLATVRSLGLPDCWVGAGFIRNAVWDYLHDRVPSGHTGDVDVVWFCPERTRLSEDKELEASLRTLDPSFDWSVKNQARMHMRNGDAPYASTVEAIGHWPETATAVAARQMAGGSCEIAAPFELGDLFDLILRPTPRFAREKRTVYLDRAASKGWLAIWPRLRIAP